MIADRASNILIDPDKVHAIEFQGEYYRCRGPLNSGPLPQGRAVIAQAGGSPRGRSFAAQHADTVVAHMKGVEAMKAYRDDIRAKMVACGRDPNSCKVLFLIAPILADTMEEAEQRARGREAAAARSIDYRLAAFAKTTNIDFSKLDIDKPLPEDITTNGHQQNLVEFRKKAAGRSIREAIMAYTTQGLSVDLVGTCDSVAAQMAETMQAVGGDGFLFSLPNVNRRTIAEITDGLVPALQQRGLVRKTYAHKMFRDNLLEF
jgi:alkanesulfonate monooxygenase SsuD/methylene tetrahydromethanopterin reductase-like flavin-dependent oxidoreductase (luciferase family)